MSVTFQIESIDTGAYTFTCYSDYMTPVQHGPYSNYDGALLGITGHKAICQDCDLGGVYPNAVQDVDLSINLSNTNAALILETIGINVDFEYGISGRMGASDFLGHVMVALAADRDGSAVPAVTYSTPGHASFTDCGLPENYVQGRLEALADIAYEAMRLGRDIVWA